MTHFLFEGFLLGLAYASPIGVQNIFVISNALQNGVTKSLLTSVIVAVMDISLAVACILGVGRILQQFTVLQIFITILGCAYLLYVSYQMIRELKTTADLKTSAIEKFSWWSVSQKAFLLTWLNPHALLDGTTILGGYAGGLQNQNRLIFGTGVATASLTWFLCLSLTAALISQSGKSAKYLKLIKLFSSITISIFAIKMLLNLGGLK
ncbi:MAG: LysE/ArgO family amino acid transporter [Neobacillus sp.]